MTKAAATTLPARTGVAFRMAPGERVRIINTHGTQVVDFWAFVPGDPPEALSMPHSRNAWYRMSPRPGDPLLSDRRRTLLTLVEDRSPGIHDTLIPCCDAVRYAQLGHPGHASCAGNFMSALEALGVAGPALPPPPLNLFMNVPMRVDGSLGIAPPDSKPGDSVMLRAERDCVVVLSACPHDIFPVNGADCTPRDVQYELLPPE
jgi:uncharacterized protein YcgI (DUF1989 family)